MESLAKATKGKAGMAVGTAHVRRSTAGTGLRVGEASAGLPATSEFMDVTAGETAPFPVMSRLGNWEMTDILDRLSNAHSCIERGLDLDRDMRFHVNGNGPGSSTSFSIERDLFWEAMREITRLRRIKSH